MAFALRWLLWQLVLGEAFCFAVAPDGAMCGTVDTSCDSSLAGSTKAKEVGVWVSSPGSSSMFAVSMCFGVVQT